MKIILGVEYDMRHNISDSISLICIDAYTKRY